MEVNILDSRTLRKQLRFVEILDVVGFGVEDIEDLNRHPQ
jgi:hypothetical protein